MSLTLIVGRAEDIDRWERAHGPIDPIDEIVVTVRPFAMVPSVHADRIVIVTPVEVMAGREAQARYVRWITGEVWLRANPNVVIEDWAGVDE